ncbi:glycosyltransferase family 4 protein [Georgenia wutianyii]|uniref:Glycosyltransferase family 4 protein n=1 Tax=Georgenia wutianyii TaxID=2585135 RepID=A0ABX5VPJ2_9MICO|nr:glycosyltransferase [Georgenia wutianyii]QDB78460.1 glycosyltransferase family 4 protein [Georgenia wutianyii]
MRVVAVSTWFPTSVAPSSGAFVVKDALAIASLGHDVRVVHLVPPHQDDGTRSLVHEGLPVRRVPMGTTNPLDVVRAARALTPLLAGGDLVHSMAISSLLPLSLHRPAAPWVHTEHWSGLTSPQNLPATWRRALPVVSRVLRRPDVVTAVCEFLAQPIRAVRGPRPTRVVPCIVETPEPLPPRPARTDVLRLVSVGGLIDRKDPVTAVETVAELERRGTPAELVLVGEGELRAAVVQRSEELGIAHRVRLTGSLPRPAVLAELAAADLFLGPTKGDNFFVSAAEAIVSGRPVVVGATGGQGEYIDPRVGELVAEQTPAAYADAVLRVEAATRDLSAEEISATIGDRFSVPAVADGYERAYCAARELRP